MTINNILKTILTLRPDVQRVLLKVRFPDSKATDLKFWTVILTTRYERTYIENFRSLSATAAEKQETEDGGTDRRTT
jgi:hypothetical protein